MTLISRETLLRTLIAGLVLGGFGASALLAGLVDPSSDFFTIMAAVIGVTSGVIVAYEPGASGTAA